MKDEEYDNSSLPFVGVWKWEKVQLSIDGGEYSGQKELQIAVKTCFTLKIVYLNITPVYVKIYILRKNWTFTDINI